MLAVIMPPAIFAWTTMKFLFDIFPVLLFFVAFKLWDVYTATEIGRASCRERV